MCFEEDYKLDLLKEIIYPISIQTFQVLLTCVCVFYVKSELFLSMGVHPARTFEPKIVLA